MSAAFSEGYSRTTAMLLGLLSASSAADARGFRLGLNLVGRRGVQAISEDAGGEILLDACEEYAKSFKGGGFMALLPMSMFLEFGHVRHHQIGLNNLPQVLGMSKLGGASSMAQFIIGIPLQLIEAREKRRNQNIERRAAGLMEDEIEAAVLFLQAKILCAYFHWERAALMAPEPEAPL